jgi:hypothetical protein
MLSLLVLFLLGFSVLSVRERMVRGLIILIYNIHHFSFLMFYLVSYLDETVKKKIYTTNVCGIVGIVVIFTVVCGAGVEIINFAITVLLTILSLCTRFVTYLCL